MTATIHSIEVQPKQLTETYKGCKITITYKPDIGKWEWTVTRPRMVMQRWHGEVARLCDAKRVAHQSIDKMVK